MELVIIVVNSSLSKTGTFYDNNYNNFINFIGWNTILVLTSLDTGRMLLKPQMIHNGENDFQFFCRHSLSTVHIKSYAYIL